MYRIVDDRCLVGDRERIALETEDFEKVKDFFISDGTDQELISDDDRYRECKDIDDINDLTYELQDGIKNYRVEEVN